MITSILDPKLDEAARETIARCILRNSERSGACRIFTGRLHDGYGRIECTHAGERVRIMTHKATYELLHGRLPPSTVVRHTCDNRACFIDAHLIGGTHLENMADMVERGRSARGERNPSARLTDAIVRDIFAACQTGASRAQVAQMFGVDRSLVSRIANGRRWRHITEKELEVQSSPPTFVDVR